VPLPYERLADPSEEEPEEERGGMGVNLCQPSPLPAPRPFSELTELPGRGTELQFELPCVSAGMRLLFSAGRLNPLEPLFEVAPECANSRVPSPAPLFPSMRVGSPVCELLAPIPRAFPFTGETPFCRIALESCDCSCSNDLPPAIVLVPWGEKKWLPPRLTRVLAAAGRPLALRLARVGVTGRFPVAKCAFCSVA